MSQFYNSTNQNFSQKLRESLLNIFFIFLGFDCPYGIKILKIFVTKHEYAEIMSAAKRSPYKMNLNSTKQSAKPSSRKRIVKLPVTYNKKESSLDLGSRESLLSDNSFDSNRSFNASLSDSLESVRSSSSDNIQLLNSAANGKSLNDIDDCEMSAPVFEDSQDVEDDSPSDQVSILVKEFFVFIFVSI